MYTLANRPKLVRSILAWPGSSNLSISAFHVLTSAFQASNAVITCELQMHGGGRGRGMDAGVDGKMGGCEIV